jgi:VanZ family protein
MRYEPSPSPGLLASRRPSLRASQQPQAATAMTSLKLSVACLVLCIALLAVGLWPLNFRPGNDVHWLQGRNGLHFQGDNNSVHRPGGVALTGGPLVLPRESGQAISIEIWLQPEAEPHGEIYHILSFYDRQKKTSFFVGQWKSYLIVRKNFFGPDHKRHYKEIDVKGALEKGKAPFLTIISDGKGTTIYLNGRKMKNAPSFFLLHKGERLSECNILLGNSSSVEGAWSGDVFGLAIYSRALNGQEVIQGFDRWTQQSSALPHLNRWDAVALYAFSERSGRIAHNALGASNPLLIPAILPFKKVVLEPLDFSRHSVQDIIVNVLGFIPFGFLLVLWLRQRWPDRPYSAFNCAVLIGLFVSLTIELVQVYLPTRDSSQMDLLCNVVGTIVGGILALRANSTHRPLRSNRRF